MSDKPFKMQGHTLPGPNQRSALKRLKQGDEGFGETGMFGAKGRLAYANAKLQGQDVGSYEEWKTGGKSVGEGYEGGEEYSAIKEAENTQPYVDSGIDDSGTNTLDTMGDDTTKKKKVDVEVTVNGEPV